MNNVLKETLETIPDWAKNNVALVGLRGSDAHGTKLSGLDISTDDTDVFVVVVRNIDFYLSLEHSRPPVKENQHHWEQAGAGIPLDILVYDITKLVGLLEQGNPNVLNWLWNRPEDYLFVSVEGKKLIDARELFLSEQIYSRLLGYALGQMQLATTPNRKYQGYMGEKRKKLVDTHGFDIKSAGHSYRLAKMALEFKRKGTLFTYRPEDEIEVIKDIKKGVYSLEEVKSFIDFAKECFDKATGVVLPEKPDRKKINQLLYEMIYFKSGT